MNPLRTFLRTVAARAARSYVAGPHLSDALAFALGLQSDGMRSTLAYWNEVADDPSAVCAAYVAAIDGAADAGLQSSISIKAPALAMAERLVEDIAERGRDRGIGVHFDSLAVEDQGRTFDLIARLGPRHARIGCTVPARFGRSLEDVERAVALGLRVRVVKGQWDDARGPADLRRGFMTLIDRLAGRAAHVAVATHDPGLAEQALSHLASRGTPADLELLLGLPMRAPMAVARRLNAPVRVYVPYGHAWLPYAVSSARRNPRVLWWLLEDAMRGPVPRRHRRP